MCAFASHCTSFTSACAAMFDCHNRPLTHEHRTHQCGRVPPVFAMLVDVGLRVQNAWGLWGVAGSADAMRAPRVGTLLSFYAALGTGSVDVPQKPARFFACDQIFRNWPGWIPRNVQQADYVVSALSVIECVLTVYALWF
eukprot:m.496454 g.496454  ORF g.496454 m.496454 type:complete len:140 (-) comp21809_c0_seq20:801-1220(-)